MFPYIGKHLNYTVSKEDEWQPPRWSIIIIIMNTDIVTLKTCLTLLSLFVFDICRLPLITI
jgi:hypothetical protein